jgi:diadenosine tetraphosphatase ApaH/serine/threonine PP2A family protein phosphatase
MLLMLLTIACELPTTNCFCDKIPSSSFVKTRRTMRYGVFSDIHSNLEAMTATLNAMKAEGTEEYLCSGDLVGYYSNPNEVIELIEKMRCWKLVLGNHDAGCIGTTSLSHFNPSAAEAILWTQPRLKPKNRRFLENLRLREEIGNNLLVHSSPFQSEEWHYLIRQEDLERNFRYFQGFICFFGHVHEPFVAEQSPDGSVVLLKKSEYKLKKDCRYFANSGSVGQPRDGDPRACYLIYDSSDLSLSVRRVEYDYATTAKKTLDAGLPDSLAQRLKLGK